MGAAAVSTIRIPWVLGLTLALGCKSEEPSPSAAQTGEPVASEQAPVEPATAAPEVASPSAATLDRLFRYLPGESIAVCYDRLSKRFDPAVLEVVYALPPKAGDLLDKRKLLDEGLTIVLDGDSAPEHWLSPTSLGFSLRIGKTPYFLRPLSKPAAEVEPLLEQGFRKLDVDGVNVWRPTGAFPWRVALLDDEVAAFIPVDALGSGVEPLLAAREIEASAVEQEIGGALRQDPSLELVLASAQPHVHLDVDQSIAQVQFGLRRQGQGYEGQVVLTPTESVDTCLDQLRARKHPEENQQVQALVAAVEFAAANGSVLGRLALEPQQLVHFLD